MDLSKFIDPQIKLPVNYEELTPAQRRDVRNEYYRRQGGKCFHCKSDLQDMPSMELRGKTVNPKLFPPSFFKWPVHLHHDHKTGMTIGAVHNHCNAVLWQYHGE